MKCPCEAVISASTVQSLQIASLAAETTGGQILIAFLPKHDLRSNLRVPNFPGGACPQTPLASSHLCEALDKWVLECVKAPPNFWHLYLKDIVHSHSTQLLIMCNESQHLQNKKKTCLRPCYAYPHPLYQFKIAGSSPDTSWGVKISFS